MYTNADLIIRRRARAGLIATCAAMAVALLAPAVSAQQHEPDRTATDGGVDARWHPWMGCWEQLRDTIHEPAQAHTRPPARGPAGAAASGDTRVCVEPDDAGAVRLRTEVQGRTVRQDTIVADGSRRPLVLEHGCGGWKQAEWSVDGRRLFGRAEIVCTGQPPRAVSQLSLLTGDGWFEFEGTMVAGREAVRVRRYRRAGDFDETGRDRTVARAFDLAAVREAGGKVAPLVLQAALVETRSRFVLDSRSMLALHDAGVPADVTDLMVALSYPRRFRVERPSPDGSFVGAGGWIEDPFWRYTPAGYSYWGGGGGWWGAPGMFFVDPGFYGGGDGRDVPRGDRGRVINNQGYTRIESRDTARERTGRTSSGSTASTSGSSGSSGSTSGAGSSSGGVSSSGYSSGGSSGDGGRSAVPR